MVYFAQSHLSVHGTLHGVFCFYNLALWSHRATFIQCSFHSYCTAFETKDSLFPTLNLPRGSG